MIALILGIITAILAAVWTLFIYGVNVAHGDGFPHVWTIVAAWAVPLTILAYWYWR